MFAYNPQVNDRSGEILAAGQMQAANTQAQMMGQLGQDIGGALANIGNMYGEIEGMKAKGRAFKKTLEVLGPSIGMTTDTLKAAFGDLKNDMDYYNASEMFMPVMPAMINATLAGNRMSSSAELQNQRIDATNRNPVIRATVTNQQNVANQGGPSVGGATRRFGAGGK